MSHHTRPFTGWDESLVHPVEYIREIVKKIRIFIR